MAIIKRLINMKKYVVLLCLLILSSLGINASEYKSLTLPRIQVVPIQDTQSGGQYELFIKLPEGYSIDNGKKYPVIYTTDAMWHIEILSGSAEFIVEDSILVGISWQKDSKAPEEHYSRNWDYTFLKSKKSKYKSGEASNHITFMRNDVFTFVEKNYQADPNNRTYFGYSLGGAFGTYILLTQPDSFKNYVLGSPAFGKESLQHITELVSISALKPKELTANVFISYGELEKELGKKVEKLITKLKASNFPNLLLKQEIIKSSDHGRAFPMTAVRSMYWLEQFIESKK